MLHTVQWAREVDKITEQSHEIDDDFVRDLRYAISKLARSQRAQRQRDMRPLPYSHSSALATLDRLGSTTPTQLAVQEGVRKPSITRVLAILEQQGLVRRATDPTDARQNIVRITPAGRRAVTESRQLVDQWYRSLLAQIEPEDVQTLRESLPALRALADKTY